MPESAIKTWKEIAKMFSVSESKMRRFKDELLDCGAIWYTHNGKPPRRIVCAWPSVLKAWMIKKSAKGEIL